MKKYILLFATILGTFGITSFANAFSDVHENNDFAEAITSMQKQNIMEGYPNDLFKPNTSITRAEFIKVLIAAQTKEPLEKYVADCFPDVKKTDWFSKYVCYAKTKNIVKGQLNGRFKPHDAINIAETVEIVTKAFGIKKNSTPAKYWYSNALQAMAENHYLPSSLKFMNQELTRGEVAEILWRTLEENHTKSSIDPVLMETNFCQNIPNNPLPNIDLAKMRATWLEWYNAVRTEQKLSPYKYNDQLNRTATVWSKNAVTRGYIDHKRTDKDTYYNYQEITNWFKALGVQFKNSNGFSYSENIAWGPYECTAKDCTESLNKAIRTGFNFFMSEKGKSYRPHYDSVVSPNFKEIGLGVSVDEAKKRFYLTVHYATALDSTNFQACSE